MERINAESVWHDVKCLRDYNPKVNILGGPALELTGDILASFGCVVMAGSLAQIGESIQVSRSLAVSLMEVKGTQKLKKFITSPIIQREGGIKTIYNLDGIRDIDSRKHVARKFLKSYTPTIIRGDIWEIFKAFERKKEVFHNRYNSSWEEGTVLNVDLPDTAEKFAQETKSVVVLSDKEKIISDGENTVVVQNGDDRFARYIAKSQLETALLVAFQEVNPSPFQAAVHAMIVAGILAEKGAENADGPGSFKMKMLDGAHNFNVSDITDRLRYRAVDALYQLNFSEIKVAYRSK